MVILGITTPSAFSMARSFFHWIGIILSLIIIFSSTQSFAQAVKFQQPVKWSFSTKRISDNEAELTFKAKIDEGWHLYSQVLPEGGPIPTSFTFNKSPEYELAGKVKEGKPVKKFEKTFEMELSWFEKSATFTQKVNVKAAKPFKITGFLEYMVCNDEMCLPPTTVDFEFSLEAAKGGTEDQGSGTSGSTGPTGQATGVTGATGSTGAVGTGVNTTAGTAGATGATVSTADTGKAVISINGDEEKTNGKGKSMTTIFILGFLGGLAALMTPCVFPMIPLTVSFFTKQSKTRKKGIMKATQYSAFIIFIYVFLGFLITVLFGANALNELASNEWMNLIFFIIFVVFGLSFLGAFEITLPSSWINKADAASEKGGLLGIFFMAFTLSLVSFSCTGPIIGSLLVEAAYGGSKAGPLVGMFGFALALALPFGLFAAFPGWLNSLPKSGGWLNNVKVVLGLAELAFALKFLSVTDLQGLHIESLDFHINGPLGILKREVFLALWIVIFSLMGFYLLGKIRFSHDSPVDHVSVPKTIFAIIVFSFVVYLIPGMWGAPLKMISGFPPPAFHSENWNAGATGGGHAPLPGVIDTLPKPPATAHCPHDINCFNDYDAALAYAKQVGKPLMIDFTGWSCVNCRRMEENVWVDPGVLQRIKNDYVLVSLYVDERTPLDSAYVSPVTGRKVRTIGDKWTELEAERYGRISQPWYVLLDHEEKELTKEGRGYDEDIAAYIKFLDEGKAEFKRRMEAKKAGAKP